MGDEPSGPPPADRHAPARPQAGAFAPTRAAACLRGSDFEGTTANGGPRPVRFNGKVEG